MPSLANWSMRGVDIVPPYTPKFPQPTLSTRMKTMLEESHSIRMANLPSGAGGQFISCPRLGLTVSLSSPLV